MKRRKVWSAIGLLVVLAINVTACGSQGAASKEAEYKYGTVEIPCLDGALCGAPLWEAFPWQLFK